MSSDRLTFNSYKKDKPDHLKPPSVSPRQPPNPSVVRLCRLAFPVFFLANFAISAYIFTRAKQRDEGKRIPSKLQNPRP